MCKREEINENTDEKNTNISIFKNLVTVDLKHSTKTINKFIDTVKDFMGWFVPEQKRINRAIADVEISKIKSKGKIEVSAIEDRAVNRLLKENIIEQNNIDNIVKNSPRFLSENVSEETVDKDWSKAFFNKAKNISNKEMQSI